MTSVATKYFNEQEDQPSSSHHHFSLRYIEMRCHEDSLTILSFHLLYETRRDERSLRREVNGVGPRVEGGLWRAGHHEWRDGPAAGGDGGVEGGAFGREEDGYCF